MSLTPNVRSIASVAAAARSVVGLSPISMTVDTKPEIQLSVLEYGDAGSGDWKTYIDAALADATAAANGTTVVLPPRTGGYTTSGGHVLGSLFTGRVHLNLGGNQVTHTGDNACFAIKGHPGEDRHCSISDGWIVGNSGSSGKGIEITDCYRSMVRSVRVDSYTNGTGILLHNVAWWTEGVQILGYHSYANKYGIRLLADSGANSSFGHQRWLDCSFNVPASGTGISADGVNLSGTANIYLYASWIRATMWIASNGIALDIGTKAVTPGYSINSVEITGECEGGSSGQTAIRSQSGSTFRLIGFVDINDTPFTGKVPNSISGSLVYRSLLPTDWNEIGAAGQPAFQNSWTNTGTGYETAAFRREGDRVFLKGDIKSGTLGATMFTLPAGYRPPLVQVFRVYDGVAYVYGDGQVQILGAGSNTKNSLNGISFSPGPV